MLKSIILTLDLVSLGADLPQQLQQTKTIKEMKIGETEQVFMDALLVDRYGKCWLLPRSHVVPNNPWTLQQPRFQVSITATQNQKAFYTVTVSKLKLFGRKWSKTLWTSIDCERHKWLAIDKIVITE